MSNNTASNVFLEATRLKARFNGYRGVLSAEDLWDVEESQLIEMGELLFQEQQSKSRVSFLDEEQQNLSPKDRAAQHLISIKLEVIKAIITFKREASKKAAEQAEVKQRLQRKLAIIEQKQNEAEIGQPLEDLQQEVAELQAQLQAL